MDFTPAKKLLRRAEWIALEQFARLRSNAPAPPKVGAKAVCVIEAESRKAVFEKNASIRLPPASTVKLATAILFVRAKKDLNEPVTIIKADIAGPRESSMGLRAGNVVTCRDLLHGLLMPSGNDAARAIARAIGDFIPKMNRLAAELGLSATTFKTPHGVDRKGQLSSARDLAILGAEAFSIPAVMEAAGCKSYSYLDRTIHSTVQMLGECGVVAGKTGSTPSARGCLILLADNHIIALLGSPVQFDSSLRPIPSTEMRYLDASAILTALKARPSLR